MVKISLTEKLKFKLVILISVVSFLSVIYSLYSLSKIANTVRVSKVKVAEIKRDVSLLDKILEDRKEYEGEIEKVKSSLPSTYYETSFFVEQLERLAKSGGLELVTRINQEKIKESGSYDSLLLSLNLTGSYSAISDYLSQVAKLPYHTSVDQIKINSGKGKPIADIKLKLYLQ